MTEGKEQEILELISNEPAYSKLFLKLLEFCLDAKSLQEIETHFASPQDISRPIHPLRQIVTWLVQADALQLVNDEGSELLSTTDAGSAVYDRLKPSSQLDQLLDCNEYSRELYLHVLRQCLTPMKRKDLEAMLEEQFLIKQMRVYPISFIQRLEKAGALEWVNQYWQTSECVRDALTVA